MVNASPNLQKAIAVIFGCACAISGCQSRTRVSAIQDPNIICRYEKTLINVPGIGAFGFRSDADQRFLWREAESIVLAEHEHNGGVVEELPVIRNNNLIGFQQGYPIKSYVINLATGDFSKTSRIINKTFQGWSVVIEGKCRRIS